MITRFLLLSLIATLFISCSDEPTNCLPIVYCNLQDPINDLPWLKDIVKNNPTNMRIYTSTYNGLEGIFIIDKIDTNTMFALTYYRTCDNTLLYQAGGIVGSTFPKDFDEKNTFRKQVYPK